MFANYPDVLTVEDATIILGFKSQTGVIRRIHHNRIRYLKVGRNFMIPKEYLIDYLLSDWFHKSIIEYSPYITIRNIPTKAYDYIVNGKSAIEWIVEQYAVTTDKASGIVNDPNTYAGGKYIFDLLLSIISVSLKTQELIAQLPEYKEIWISLYTKRTV